MNNQKMINSKTFNFSFFLSNREKVESLEFGAIKNGGATQYNNGIYSNIEGDEYIKVNDNNNTISIFIPSTMEVNQETDNEYMIEHSMQELRKHYNNSNSIIYYHTRGSWYSDDMQKVVIEDITIISVDMVTVTETDINIFKNLAEYIKKEMKQEGVSISINSALAIV